MVNETTKWLGTLEISGYTLTVLAETEDMARKLLLEDRERAIRAGHEATVPDGEDPFEFLGGAIVELAVGKVQWL